MRKSKQCSGGVEVVSEKPPGAKQFKVTQHEADLTHCKLGLVSGWRSTKILTTEIRNFVSKSGLRGAEDRMVQPRLWRGDTQ